MIRCVIRCVIRCMISYMTVCSPSFIPMLLQDIDPTDGQSRLKRVVLIGDHHQLPPVVKHAAFQKFSRLDQSLFSRFVRLGVPTVQLDRQGRTRVEIADLYRWRYAGR
jgi:intron-binding protein aquarius